jgi:hypothetical protein
VGVAAAAVRFFFLFFLPADIVARRRSGALAGSGFKGAECKGAGVLSGLSSTRVSSGPRV